ncbi:peroxisomal N(1)-acetyl-spermine/spermidine oxidase-like [Pristis pectinata]|uniref:peroxisomal N(1)-acetyl-spermine/spermidine oxidase-like n=1 Tax=Pristis pectinata TaxID=685728 RepID=UPI00223D335A|nr:peroxisomal N(1)-acetyl-spermine/spermidine oxidase-like [Pristis pectinata]
MTSNMGSTFIISFCSALPLAVLIMGQSSKAVPMDFKQSTNKTAKIVIIGAGIAGVGAAGKLLKEGFTDLLVVEAADQPGGRIRSSPFGKSFIIEGAQYIHGASMKNPIFQLARKYGLLQGQNNSTPECTVFTSMQEQLDSDFIEQMTNLSRYILWRSYLHSQQKGYTPSKSIGDVILEEIKKVIANWTSDSTRLRHQKLGLLNMIMKEECVNDAAQNLHDVSLQELSNYEYIEGGDRNSPQVFLKLISNMVEVIPKEKLLLKKPVKQILWNGSFASEDGSQYPVRVMCEDGDYLLADHTIATVSLGHLKAEAKTLFHPHLPVEKYHAIKNIGFGTVNKIYLEYEVPFWDKGVGTDYCIGLVWEDETPFSVLKANTAEWWRRLYGLEVLHPSERYGHMLLGWISGKEAEFIETLSDEEISSNITRVLRQFTGLSVPEPNNVYVTKWFSNPYIQGSYSHIAVKSTGDMIDTLAKPLPQEGADGYPSKMLQVLFAGEATHRSYHSTTHGALLSGWREADRLIAHYSTNEEQYPQTEGLI